MRRADHLSRVVPTECGVSERVRETLIMKRPWLSRGCCTMGEKMVLPEVYNSYQIGIRVSDLTYYNSSIFNL